MKLEKCSLLIFIFTLAASCGPESERSDQQLKRHVFSDIIGGVAAQVGQFREVVGLQFNDRIYCSGVLIDAQWVLTAAHCLRRFASEDIQVVVGQGQQNSQYYPVQRQEVSSSYFSNRESVPSTRAFGDLGLLQLAWPLEAPSMAHRPVGPLELQELDRLQVLVVGFGAREATAGTALSGEKYYVQVARLDYRPGEMIFGNEQPRQGGCHGDSGGPLFQFHPSSKRWLLTGIVSRQMLPLGPCTAHKGVATEIAFYHEWIAEIIGTDLATEKIRSQQAKRLINARSLGMNLKKNSPLDLENVYGLTASDIETSGKDLQGMAVNLWGTGLTQLPQLDLAQSWLIDPLPLKSYDRQRLLEQYPLHTVLFPPKLLIEALMRQEEDLIQLALLDNSQIKAKDDVGHSVVHWAVINDDLELVWQFVSKGADIKNTNDLGVTPLMLARSPEIQTYLLSQLGTEDLAQLTSHGWSLLHFAIERGDFQFLEALLKHGVPADLAGTEAELPFEFALIKGRSDMAELIQSYLK